MSTMKFINIPTERFCEVITHLRSTFFEDEPLNQSVQICGTSGEGHAQLEKHCMYTMAEGLSVMALSDDNQVYDPYLVGLINRYYFTNIIFFLTDRWCLSKRHCATRRCGTGLK